MKIEDTQRSVLKATVLEQINRGEVSMLPRRYFLFRMVATLCMASITLVLSVFVMSFVLFSIHEGGELFLLGFGWRGVSTFLLLFPWGLLLLNICCIMLLQYLVHGFKRTYQIPLVRFFGIVFCISTIVGFLVSVTQFHSEVFEWVESHEPPFVGALYDRVYQDSELYGEFRGVVVSRQGNTIIIAHNDGDGDDDDGTRTIILNEGVHAEDVVVGDVLYVAGDQEGDVIYAYGVRKFSK